jgi:peptidoglycan/LPS O-acetylase OafA/YrhL
LSHDVRLKLSVLYYANYFLTGFLLADVYLVSWRENPAPSLGGDLLSVFSWSGVLVLLLSPPAWELLLPPMVFLAYCGAFRGRYSSRFFSHPAIYLIGGMCYTIYLYHFYVISAVGGLVLNVLPAGLPVWGNLIVVGLVVVPAIFLICAVLFVLTEKPFMKRHWHRSVTARLAPSYRAE